MSSLPVVADRSYAVPLPGGAEPGPAGSSGIVRYDRTDRPGRSHRKHGEDDFAALLDAAGRGAPPAAVHRATRERGPEPDAAAETPTAGPDTAGPPAAVPQVQDRAVAAASQPEGLPDAVVLPVVTASAVPVVVPATGGSSEPGTATVAAPGAAPLPSDAPTAAAPGAAPVDVPPTGAQQTGAPDAADAVEGAVVAPVTDPAAATPGLEADPAPDRAVGQLPGDAAAAPVVDVDPQADLAPDVQPEIDLAPEPELPQDAGDTLAPTAGADDPGLPGEPGGQEGGRTPSGQAAPATSAPGAPEEPALPVAAIPRADASGTAPAASAAPLRPADVPWQPSPAAPTPLAPAVTSLAHAAARDGGAARIVMRLDPPELGTVVVSLTLRGGEVHVSLVAADPGAAGQLDARRAEVRSALAQAGLDLEGWSVDSGDRGRQDRQGERRSPSSGRSPSDAYGLPGDDAASPGRVASGVFL